MRGGVINSFILVESSEAESDEQFCATIESMVHQTYGHRPDWLRFSAGARFVCHGRCFRELECLAGSVSLMLMSRARRDGGFTKAILCRIDCDGVSCVYEIREGVEGELSPDELRRV